MLNLATAHARDAPWQHRHHRNTPAGQYADGGIIVPVEKSLRRGLPLRRSQSPQALPISGNHGMLSQVAYTEETGDDRTIAPVDKR